MVYAFTRSLPVAFVALALFAGTASAQKSSANDFSDRKAVLETIENFYIGDHTGSTEHKKLSMHPEGAYRYVDKSGKYRESRFRVDSDDSDDQYTEELLGVDIFENVALARLRLEQNSRDVPEYKLMTLHRVEGKWLITSISWGFGVTP
ncbi:MAG: nuclear transport factor 2 family protein [Acidobacteriota bacterium]